MKVKILQIGNRIVFAKDAVQINFGEQTKNIAMVVRKDGTRQYLSGNLTEEEFCKLIGGS